jgi:cytochrome c oxidase subunit 2
MPVPHRPRRPLPAALTAVLSLLLLGACYGPEHPNSIFTRFTEWNRDVGFLFDILIWLGMIVFVFVEVLLIITIWKYRRRPGQVAASHVHGNTKLEIIWTIIPALILVFIAVPTVQTIFRTQAKVKPGALEVEVIGRQWWWEFRYPQYTTTGPDGRVDTLVTANELYMPIGRTVNFTLRTADVIHSFWISALAGKRDLVSNHTNYLWFTPDSTDENAWNGTCNEYCGASHANMKFRAYTVSATNFESWARNQLAPAIGAAAPAAAGQAPAVGAPGQAAVPTGGVGPVAALNQAAVVPVPGTQPSALAQEVASAVTFTHFPAEKLGEHNIPRTPIPAGVGLAAGVVGDAARGGQLFASGAGACIGCHKIRGVPTAMGIIGPNLTHVGGRHTIAAGLFPNDLEHLAAWIKNARAMKPGVLMPTLAKGQYDPVTKATLQAGLTDQQAADIAAYLLTLK